MVALSLPHSKQWEACWRYVIGVVDLAVVPTGRGSSPAEEPGSSLDVAGRTDTEQGNRASSALVNTADADSVEEPEQEDDVDSLAARTVAEKHEQDEDLGALPSSATMAGTETSGQNGELGTPAEATTVTQPVAGSTMPISHQPAEGSQIATRFGFHRTTVARHLKETGKTLRTDPADPAFQERVWQAYSSGWLSTPPKSWALVRIWVN